MKSLDIIRGFLKKKQFCFSFKEVRGVIKEGGDASLYKFLQSMVNVGMLVRISKGLYYIVPVNESVESFVPDWRRVANCLTKDKDSYLAYHSAMQIHGLVKDSGSTIYIAINSRGKKRNSVSGVNYEYINQKESRFFGYEERWINLNEKVKVSELEKTIVDITTRPQFSGGIENVAKAINISHDSIDESKLLYYFACQGSQAAKRRYLFLHDLLGFEWSGAHELLLRDTGRSYSVLDPASPKIGKRNSMFRLIENIDPGQLLEFFGR